VAALSGLGRHVILPLHPRTRVAMSHAGLEFGPDVEVRQPASYLEFTALLRGAEALLTDSGGAQKEAYFHGIPCVTLRETTEWVETVQAGWNVLAPNDAGAIRAALERPRPAERPPLYGDGHAAERIAAALTTGR
jgi:UDP-N-acetylglucosamine 2-epimerase